MTEQDISNFTSTPTSSTTHHRLPTISASLALKNLALPSFKPLTTGLSKLDAALDGGIPRGGVTEVYGPPGVGKTGFCLQTCAHALRASHHVVWIDACYPVPGPRLNQILTSCPSPPTTSSSQTPTTHLLKNFHHYFTPTLPHLLALLLTPPPSSSSSPTSPTFPPPGTSLLILDSISTLFSNAFPKNPTPQIPTTSTTSAAATKAKEKAKWTTTRKYAIAATVISKLEKLATVCNLAVMVTGQSTTKVRREGWASGFGGNGDGGEVVGTIEPIMTGPSWDSGIANRIVLYRDFWHYGDGGVLSIRIAEVLKVSSGGGGGGGGGSGDAQGKKIPFSILEGGLIPFSASCSSSLSPLPIPIPIPSLSTSTPQAQIQTQTQASLPLLNQHPNQDQNRNLKRKHLEIADSEPESESESLSLSELGEGGEEEESYGWADEDDDEFGGGGEGGGDVV
ncbi:MAG: hypothetical protein M1834_003971 [Cirrosporium novae-zelandiae]|nr:MAG: hypothetical protein M1834_003971 [Cirrosporium novae-zelandiae]